MLFDSPSPSEERVLTLLLSIGGKFLRGLGTLPYRPRHGLVKEFSAKRVRDLESRTVFELVVEDLRRLGLDDGDDHTAHRCKGQRSTCSAYVRKLGQYIIHELGVRRLGIPLSNGLELNEFLLPESRHVRLYCGPECSLAWRAQEHWVSIV